LKAQKHDHGQAIAIEAISETRKEDATQGLDAGAARPSGGSHSRLAALAALDRPKNG
jgi:hypothetical protein